MFLKLVTWHVGYVPLGWSWVGDMLCPSMETCVGGAWYVINGSHVLFYHCGLGLWMVLGIDSQVMDKPSLGAVNEVQLDVGLESALGALELGFGSQCGIQDLAVRI